MIPNGTFTLTNPEGKHRTFSIKTQAKDSTFCPGKRVVALLTGSDNEADYRGFGFLEATGTIHLWHKMKTKTFEWYKDLLQEGGRAIEALQHEEEPAADFMYAGRQYRIQAAKRCMVCNRKLTTPESIRTGIGPICARGGTDGDA